MTPQAILERIASCTATIATIIVSSLLISATHRIGPDDAILQRQNDSHHRRLHVRRSLRPVRAHPGATYGQAHSRKPKHHRSEYARRRFAERDQLRLRRGETGRLDVGHAGQRHLSRSTARTEGGDVRRAQNSLAGQRRSARLVALHESRGAVEIHRRRHERQGSAQMRLHRNFGSDHDREQCLGRNLGSEVSGGARLSRRRRDRLGVGERRDSLPRHRHHDSLRARALFHLA